MLVSLRKLTLVLTLIVLASFALVACGGTSTGTNEPVEVQVTLSDSPSGAMSMESSQTTFSTGVPYHFVVTNTGSVEHEFMIMPPVEPGTMSMTEMDKMALVVIEEDDLSPGATQSVDYTFTKPAPAGTLEFACHVTGHYEAGMKLPIVVE